MVRLPRDGRIQNNGPVTATPPTIATASAEASREEPVGSEFEANGSVISTSGQDQGGPDGDGDGDGEEVFTTAAAAAAEAEAPPPRPTSPLGQGAFNRYIVLLCCAVFKSNPSSLCL